MSEWATERVQDFTANDVYEILDRHKLLPVDAVHAAAVCNATAADCDFYILKEGEDVVAHVFVGPVLDGDSAMLDLIIQPKRFRNGFDEPLGLALAPILDDLFTNHRVRRITSQVPYSRSRTKRALCSLGFVHEARIRQGVHLFGADKPEDLRGLGLLKEEYYAR